ncbi:hypothetical protein SDC9_167396 [bioreactor metagenome]|uniref:Uncharacterized protein n=1 Tax=bioreactor metagenome TaxID=1076179 RepID=A0A645G295_9ZZZZ
MLAELDEYVTDGHARRLFDLPVHIDAGRAGFFAQDLRNRRFPRAHIAY